MDSLSHETQCEIWRSDTPAMIKEIVDNIKSCDDEQEVMDPLSVYTLVYLLGNIDSDVNYESMIEGQHWNHDVRIISQAHPK